MHEGSGFIPAVAGGTPILIPFAFPAHTSTVSKTVPELGNLGVILAVQSAQIVLP